MTDRLDEIKERASRATPGPWRLGTTTYRCKLDHGKGTGGHGGSECIYTFDGWWESGCGYDVSVDKEPATRNEDDESLICGQWNYEYGGVKKKDDAEFIAHSREDVDWLVKELETANKLIKHWQNRFDKEQAGVDQLMKRLDEEMLRNCPSCGKYYNKTIEPNHPIDSCHSDMGGGNEEPKA